MVTSRPLKSRISQSVVFGGLCALIFAPTFLVFLILTILMVGGDGTAPGVTHLSAAILTFTVNLLGVSSDGGVAPVTLFWSLVVFVVAFLGALAFKDSPQTEKSTWGATAVVALVALGAVATLMRAHHGEQASVREKALVLEFVQNNPEIAQLVGGKPTVFLDLSMRSQDGRIGYDIAVSGTRKLHAIVEVSSREPTPTFKLLCTTSLDLGRRDPFKPPCEQ